METFALKNFPNAYRKDKQTLCFGEDYDFLKKNVAPIDRNLIEKNKKVEFFFEKKPKLGKWRRACLFRSF